MPGWFGYTMPKAPRPLQIFIDRITHPYFQSFAFAILITMLLTDATIASVQAEGRLQAGHQQHQAQIAPAIFAFVFLVGGIALAGHYIFNVRDSFGDFCKPVPGGHARSLHPDDMGLCKRASDGSFRHLHAALCRGAPEFDTAMSAHRPRSGLPSRNYGFVLEQNGEWSFLGASSAGRNAAPRVMASARIMAGGVQRSLALRGLGGGLSNQAHVDRPFGRVIVRYGETGNEENFIDASDILGRSILDETFRATHNGEMFVYLNQPVSGVFQTCSVT